MRPYIGSNRHINKLLNGMLETTMKGKIIITYTPKNDYDLVSKEYVDNIVNNLDLSKIEGTVSKNSFPNYPGDFVKTNNEYMLRHKATAFTKPISVTIGTNGLVTKGSNKIPPELFPDVDNTIIDKTTYPKTPEEMGITDTVKLDGTGKTNKSFIYKEAGTRADAPVTRNKADMFFSPLVKYAVGDIVIIESGTDKIPTDFRLVDGSSYNKKTFSTLHSVIGDYYSENISSTHGVPNKQPVFSSMDDSLTPSFSDFDAGDLEGLGGYSCFTTKNRVYFVGGFYGDYGIISNKVYTSTITDGVLSKPVRVSDFPENRVFARAVTFENKVYIIGGGATPTNNTERVYVYVANIESDGTIGPWTKTNLFLQTKANNPLVYTVARRLYIIGGFKYDTISPPDRYETQPTLTAFWVSIDTNGKFGQVNSLGTSNNFGTYGLDYFWYGNRKQYQTYGYKLNGKDRKSIYQVYDSITPRAISYPPTQTMADPRYIKTHSRGANYFWEYSPDNIKYPGIRGVIVLEYGNDRGSIDSPFESAVFSMINTVKDDYLVKTITTSIDVPNKTPRAYFDIVTTSKYVYIIGGLTDDPGKMNGRKLPSKSFMHTVAGFSDNYEEHYDVLPVDQNLFKIPSMEPSLYNNVMYNYYIKVK